jgi:cold-inducible RNA-binding protein
VEKAKVVVDRVTGEPRGFDFVEMKDARSADQAIKKLDGAKLVGTTLVVRPAEPARND